jgi:hypothetical protein
MDNFSFITACVDKYPMEYANKSASMLKRNCKIPFKSYCITERPHELIGDILPIKPERIVKGWWNKVLSFSPKMPEGWILVMDIDLIIINDLTEVIDYAMKNTAQIAAYSDAIHWMNCKFSSSFMLFRSGDLAPIFNNFMNDYETLENRPGGDQVWIEPQLDSILYLDEKFPNLKKSLKFDLATMSENKIHLPMNISSDVKIIDFHGNPKPHQLKMWPIVENNWR